MRTFAGVSVLLMVPVWLYFEFSMPRSVLLGATTVWFVWGVYVFHRIDNGHVGTFWLYAPTVVMVFVFAVRRALAEQRAN